MQNRLTMRSLPITAVHVVIIIMSFALALWLRFDIFLSDLDSDVLLGGLAIIVPLKLLVFVLGGLHRGSWRYTGVSDLARIGAANIAASALSSSGMFLWVGTMFSRSVYLIDFVLCFTFCVLASFAAPLARRHRLSRVFSHAERDETEHFYPQWLPNLLLTVSSFLLVLAAILGVGVYKLARRSPGLEDLSTADRQRLIQMASEIVPPVYQPFPLSGPLSFYHMAPNTLYTALLGDTFTTNDLGFRTIATTPKPANVRRIVVVGDSWTFGQGVRANETLAYQLETMLNRNGGGWQVYDLAMPGWNTANEIAALHTFFSKLRPDVVVFCPTSNDIDDSYDVWNGRLVLNGFVSGAAFRHSYEYQTRWTRVFQKLQSEVDDLLQRRRVPSLIYFLAEWRKLTPYYASLSGLKAPYTVVPTEYLDDKYRLPNDHATPEGYRLIASYLHNALVEGQLLAGVEPLPADPAVAFPGHVFDGNDVQNEFKSYVQYFRRLDAAGSAEDLMGKEKLINVEAPAAARTVSVQLSLLDDIGLYPLTVEVGLRSSEQVAAVKVFDHFVAEPQVIELSKPASLDGFSTIEVRVSADRSVIDAKGLTPVSMKKPRVQLR